MDLLHRNKMNSIFAQAVEQGCFVAPDGYILPFATPSISEKASTLLAEIVASVPAPKVLEIGLAFGVSTVHIAEAIQRAGSGALSSIDPFQTTDFHSIGLANLRQAGLNIDFTLIEEPSHLALPSLLRSQRRFDVIFIDGWHSTDYVLVDFFYSDLLLNDGGIIVFHDASQRATSKVLRMIESSKPYSLYATVRASLPRSARFKRAAYSFARGFVDAPVALIKHSHISEPAPFNDECRAYRKLRSEQVNTRFYRPF